MGRRDTAPASISDEVTVAADQLDPAATEALGAFFERAFAQETSARYANAQDAAAAWDRALAQAAASDRVRDPDLAAAAATLSTPLGEAGFSARAISAVERYAVGTVADLLGVDPFELARLPGASQRTKDEVVRRAKHWRGRLRPAGSPARSVDAVVARLLRDVPLEDAEGRSVRAIMGQPDAATSTAPMSWPTTQLVANEFDVDRALVSEAWRAFTRSTASCGPCSSGQPSSGGRSSCSATTATSWTDRMRRGCGARRAGGRGGGQPTETCTRMRCC